MALYVRSGENAKCVSMTDADAVEVTIPTEGKGELQLQWVLRIRYFHTSGVVGPDGAYIDVKHYEDRANALADWRKLTDKWSSKDYFDTNEIFDLG